MAQLQIAIDGPAGAGKSTIAKLVAERLGIVYLDTGAMYRAVGLKALRKGIDPLDEQAVSQMMKNTGLMVAYDGKRQVISLDGEDVTGLIRTPEVSAAASAVSKWTGVRRSLVESQRAIAHQQDVVMDGRDIGTHVLPDAPYKFFITASVEERARRRALEESNKGNPVDLRQTMEDIAARDHQDSNREQSPLRQAEDAVLIDTTGLDIDEVVQKVLEVLGRG